MFSYHTLTTDILVKGKKHSDRTGVGTYSLFGYQWRHDMRDGFPLLTTKRLPFRWIAEELFWFLRGSTDEAELRAEGVDIWKEWSDEATCAKFGRPAGKMGLIYGGLWRDYPVGYSTHDGVKYDASTHPATVDQIAQLVDDIQNNPNSRRLIVTGWHPYYQKRVSLPPCHTLWQVKVDEEARGLSLSLYARSIDAFLGLPFNIASFGLLLTLLAKVTGLEAHDLVISFGDLHLYHTHQDALRMQRARMPKQLPTLTVADKGRGLEALLSYRWSDLVLSGYDPYPKITAPVAV